MKPSDLIRQEDIERLQQPDAVQAAKAEEERELHQVEERVQVRTEREREVADDYGPPSDRLIKARPFAAVIVIALGLVILGVALSSLLVHPVAPPAQRADSTAPNASELALTAISGASWVVAGVFLWRRQWIAVIACSILALICGAASAMG